MQIAISGAGVAGPTLAYWLLHAGHRPVLIEQAPEFRSGGYMIDFWGSGYAVAEKMGLLPEIKRSGYAVQEVRMMDAKGRDRAKFSTDVFRQITNNRFTSLPRGDLAEIIYRSIEPRVETLFDNSIEAIDESASGVRVDFRRGPSREFDLVVGADGLHSRVRELVFGPQAPFEKRLGYQVAACQATGYRPRDELTYVAFAIPGRQVARVSMRDDRTMFLFVFTDDCLSGVEPQDLAARKSALHAVFGDAGWECPQILQAVDRLQDIYFDRVSQIHLDRWSQGRVVLLGDAAACVSLMAGEGSGLAMTAAYVLAGELGRAGDDYGRAFRGYEDRLRPLIERKQLSAARFAAAFAPKTRFGIWFRNQVARLLHYQAIVRYFVANDLRDDFPLPDYGL